MFDDHFGDLFKPEEIAGRAVAEVGSGSGRIVNMICSFALRKCYAIEPSAGFDVLKANTKRYASIVEYISATGDKFDLRNLDLVFSIGVVHHIKDPGDVIRNIYRSLRPGGAFLIWVYGREGNGPYLAFYRTVSWLTKHLPDSWLDRFSAILVVKT